MQSSLNNPANMSTTPLTQASVDSAQDRPVKKRRATRTVLAPPQSVVNKARRALRVSEEDINLASAIISDPSTQMQHHVQWLDSYIKNVASRPLGLLSCASTVTAISGVVEALTQTCNESITPLVVNADTTFKPADLDPAVQRLTALSEQLAGIAARFKDRQAQIVRVAAAQSE